MKTLNVVEIEEVAGGATGNCMYDGKSYSPGAVVSIGNNYYQQCRVDAANQVYWSAPYLM